MANLGIQNNNPGNLRDTKTGNFRVFDDPNKGRLALLNDIKIKQSGKSKHIQPGASLAQLGDVWAPPSDNNVKGDWARNVAKTLKVDVSHPFDKLAPEKLLQGVMVAEGTNSMKLGSPQTNNQNKLTREQMTANINAMESQGAKPEEVQGYLNSLKNTNSNSSGNPTTQSNPNQRKPFTEFMKDTANNPNADLKAGNPTVSSKIGKVGEVIAGLIPGNKFAQAIGYSLSNAMGSQKGLIEALNRSIDTQGQLLKRIQDNKAKGRDTSRLEKALSQLKNDIQTQASQIEDVGTGGITNKQVLKSAGSLAALPAAAYGSTVLGGGGVMGTSRGLTSGVLGKSANAVEPAIKAAINSSDKLGFSDILNKGLNLKDSVNLSNFEKFTRLAANDKASIIKNIISKNPELVQSVKKGILPEALNKLKWIGGTLVLDRVFGGKVGGVIKGLF